MLVSNYGRSDSDSGHTNGNRKDSSDVGVVQLAETASTPAANVPKSVSAKATIVIEKPTELDSLTAEISKDENENVALWSYVFENVDAWVFQNTSESLRQLPFPSRYIVACMVLAFAAGMFITSTNRVLNRQLTNPYISLSYSEGCVEVPQAITADFMASTEGMWQSNPHFDYNLAFYQFSFLSYYGANGNYADDMAVVKAGIERLGEAAKKQNLALNLVMLSTVVLEGRSDEISLRFMVTPTYAFLKTSWTVALGGKGYPDCDAPATVLYQRDACIFTVQFSTNQYLQTCSNYSTAIFDANSAVSSNPEYLSVYVYGRSFVTALSVNLNHIGIRSLEDVHHENANSFIYQNVKYYIVYKFLPAFPGMCPMQCVYVQGTDEWVTCLVKLGNIVGLPVINHLGNSTDSPEYCDWYC
jgi:hypothetical protein